MLWQDGALTGVVDWSGASLAPRGFDVGWCRLDLALLHGPNTTAADTFSAAYLNASGAPPPDMALWDLYTLARPHSTVETWVPNYVASAAPTSPPGNCAAATPRGRHGVWERPARKASFHRAGRRQPMRLAVNATVMAVKAARRG